MRIPPRHLATSLALGAVVACSGTALPAPHHAASVEAPQAVTEAPARAALVCPPEPPEEVREEAPEELVRIWMEEDERESDFDVESVVERALGEQARCAPHLFARSSFLQEYGSARTAIHEGTVEVDAGSSGGGVYGGSDLFFAVVDHVQCRPLITVETGWNDGALISLAEVGIAPAQEVVRLLQGSTYLRAYAHTAPEAALFQLLLRARRRDQRRTHVASTFELRGPLFGAAPTFRGTPHPSEVGYLVPTRGLRGEQLRGLRAQLDAEGEEQYEEEGEDDDES